MGSEILKIITPFITGALLVGGLSLIAIHFSTKIAALLYGFPLSLIPITLFIWIHNGEKKGKKIVDRFIGQIVPSLGGLFAFVIVFWLTLRKLPFPVAMGLGVLSWAIYAVIYWFIICPSPIGCLTIK